MTYLVWALIAVVSIVMLVEIVAFIALVRPHTLVRDCFRHIASKRRW